MTSIVSAGLTDSGKVRDHNEDAFLDSPGTGLWVVADGMGGHSAGEVASGLIVKRLGGLSHLSDPVAFMESVENELGGVNADLRRYAQERRAGLVGATVATVLACPDYFALGWAGDSRIYRFKNGKLQLLSRDHSMLQELMDSGEFQMDSSEMSPRSNAITRAVGGEERLYLDWMVAAREPETCFLVCSDGLTKELSDQRIEDEFRKNLQPRETAHTLVSAALAAGGRDNITAVVLQVRP